MRKYLRASTIILVPIGGAVGGYFFGIIGAILAASIAYYLVDKALGG